jgi:hypothetical protein
MDDLSQKLNKFIENDDVTNEEIEDKTIKSKDGLIERVEVKNVNIKVKTERGIKQLLND